MHTIALYTVMPDRVLHDIRVNEGESGQGVRVLLSVCTVRERERERV